MLFSPDRALTARWIVRSVASGRISYEYTQLMMGYPGVPLNELIVVMVQNAPRRTPRQPAPPPPPVATLTVTQAPVTTP